MLIRFNRSRSVRDAYLRYDEGDFRGVVKFCTLELAKSDADPELRLLRGVAYLDCGKPNEAAADWGVCCEDKHIAGVAHYYLGNFLSGKSLEYEMPAMQHFDNAVRLGWVEGHIGRGSILLSQGFQERDQHNRPDVATELFRQSLTELTLGMTSPASFSRRRAIGIRASVYYNLGDVEAFLRDRAEEKKIVVGNSDQNADPRATGVDLYS